MPEAPVLIVCSDPEVVEADLVAGRLRCPKCQDGALARWGFARRRVLRDGSALRFRVRGWGGAARCVGTPSACLCGCPDQRSRRRSLGWCVLWRCWRRVGALVWRVLRGVGPVWIVGPARAA